MLHYIVGNPRLIPIRSSLSIDSDTFLSLHHDGEREERIGINRGLPTMVTLFSELNVVRGIYTSVHTIDWLQFKMLSLFTHNKKQQKCQTMSREHILNIITLEFVMHMSKVFGMRDYFVVLFDFLYII